MNNATVQVRAWYKRAQIDYANVYMALYASFNAWYRMLTGGITNDRQALNIVRKGNEWWRRYCEGDAMQDLIPYMKLLVELTQREPLSHVTPHWVGEVTHTKDWPSLIEYWYRVRCLVMHGAEIQTTYVYLAYETLNIFMGEVINRDDINGVYNTSKTSYN